MQVFLFLAFAQAAIAASPPPAISTPTVSQYSIGMDLRRRGDYAGAMKVFQEMQDENPESGAALEGLTLTSMNLGKHQEALGYIEMWENLGTSPYISSLKTQVQADLQRQAPPSVSTGTAASVSASTVSYYALGMDLRKQGDFAGAKKMFQRLLEENPQSGGAFEGLTLTSMALGQDEEALGYIERWEKLGESSYVQGLKATVSAKLHPAPATPAPVSPYTAGMDLRSRGDYKGAKEIFLKMLSEDSKSGGALEGLTLTSLSLGQYQDALGYAERWEKGGDNGYIQSMKARALSKLGRREEQAASLQRVTQLDPADIQSARRLNDLLRSDARGIFPSGAFSKTLSQEGLGTGSVSQIIYESRGGGLAERLPLRSGLSLTAGQTWNESAQRNGTRGFTYFDILEQLYCLGLEARGRRAWGSVQYGQSYLSDVKSKGVGRQNFSRVRLNGNVDFGDLELRVFAERAPYFLRGAGGSQFFALLREDSVKVEAEAPWAGILWLARAGITDYSDHVTVNSESLTGTLEGGAYLVVGSVGHSYQEFIGSGPTGKLTIMPLDRESLRARYGHDEKWLASASYGHSAYRDGNRENDGAADLRVWYPWAGRLGQVWGSYRFYIEEYLAVADGYTSSDKRSHWPGLFWRRQWRRGPWTQVGYEHGFLVDTRGRYEGNAWAGEVEWHHGRPFSLAAQARYSNTTVRDESFGAGVQARWTF